MQKLSHDELTSSSSILVLSLLLPVGAAISPLTIWSPSGPTEREWELFSSIANFLKQYTPVVTVFCLDTFSFFAFPMMEQPLNLFTFPNMISARREHFQEILFAFRLHLFVPMDAFLNQSKSLGWFPKYTRYCKRYLRGGRLQKVPRKCRCKFSKSSNYSFSNLIFDINAQTIILWTSNPQK